MNTLSRHLLRKPLSLQCLYIQSRKFANQESIVDILKLSRTKPNPAAQPFRPSSLPQTSNKVSPLLQQKQRQQPQQQQGQVIKQKIDRPPRDEEITARFITLVDEKGDVHQRCRTTDVLYKIDRAHYFLVEVDPNAKPFPVCRLFDKKTLFDKEKNKKKKKTSSPSSVLKEIGITWNVTDHDIEHKLSKAFDFLDKGNKVQVNITHKKNQKLVDGETKNQLVAKIEKMLKDYKVTKKKFIKNFCSMQFEK